MMKLKSPVSKETTQEELDRMQAEIEFNEQEQVYFDDMIKRREQRIAGRKPVGDMKFYDDMMFYINEIDAVEKLFPRRVALQREIYFRLGCTYERLAVEGMEGKEPLRKAETLELAVKAYAKADEVVGFHTDFALRQADACQGVAQYRREAGFHNGITQVYDERTKRLVNGYLGQDENASVTVVSRKDVGALLQQMTGVTLEGEIASAHFVETKSKGN
jgi:hypothetical protein